MVRSRTEAINEMTFVIWPPDVYDSLANPIDSLYMKMNLLCGHGSSMTLYTGNILLQRPSILKAFGVVPLTWNSFGARHGTTFSSYSVSAQRLQIWKNIC